MRYILLLSCSLIVLLSSAQTEFSDDVVNGNLAQDRREDSIGIEEKKALLKIKNIADSLFFVQNYQKSIFLFKRMARLDPNNQYAKSKIIEIESLLVNFENPLPVKYGKTMSTEEIIRNAKRLQEDRIEKNSHFQEGVYRVGR